MSQTYRVLKGKVGDRNEGDTFTSDDFAAANPLPPDSRVDPAQHYGAMIARLVHAGDVEEVEAAAAPAKPKPQPAHQAGAVVPVGPAAPNRPNAGVVVAPQPQPQPRTA